MHQKNQKSARRRTISCDFLETRRLFSAQILFGPNVNFVAGTTPVGLVAADFSGDGNVDLAVADRATNKVNVFFGNGTGSFSAGPVLALSARPVAMITGDFNGDGRPDIAVATTAATGQPYTAVSVFLNNGNGALGLGQITTVESAAIPGEPVALAAGDFNGDKKLDLAVTGFSTQSINILSGNNNGTFTAPTTYAADQYPTAIAQADFNHDGYPDLAVTSTSLNLVNGPGSSSSASNQVSLLLGSSTGDFSAGPNIAISTTGTPASVVPANLTVAATPGLLVGNTDGTVTVLTNTRGNFSESATATVTGVTASVAAGDFNLDGNTDFVAAGATIPQSNASSAVTVVPGTGSGMVAASSQFATGPDPDAVVVADFNNDGKPDIATANLTDGTVSILLNATNIPRINTSAAVVSSGSPQPAGASVTFTATVTGTAPSPLPGEAVPTGNVNFYDGPTLLGTVALAAGTNQAVLTTSNLIVGSHRIGVSYAGDPAYASSASPRIAQVISPTATEGPDLVGTVISSTLPGTVAPGETGVVRVRVTNQGNTPAVGTIANTGYLSLDTNIDGGDAAVALRGSLAKANLHLQAGRSITLVGSVTIPQDASLGNYSLLVQLNATGSLPESVSTNNTVASPAAFAVSDVFGTVAGRAGVVLHVMDNNGTPAIFRLTGPGSGTVNIGDAGVEVLLDATSAASTLTITSPVGAPNFAITDLSADSAIGSIHAASVAISNHLTLPDGAKSVVLATAGSGQAGNAITIGSGAATAITIGAVPGADITAAGGIRSLAVGNWGSGTIKAAWIGTLHSARNFAAALSLTGAAAPAGTALGSATVGGIASGAWNVTGNVGRISIRATPPAQLGWTLNTTGTLRFLSLLNTFYGSVLADSIGSIQITGDMIGGEIASNTGLASILIRGNLVNADVLAATTSAGTLGSIRVTGSITGSLVAAGAGDGSLPLVLSPNGTIRSISVLSSVDSTTRFAAAVLPRRAVIGGASVLTAGDSSFET